VSMGFGHNGQTRGYINSKGVKATKGLGHWKGSRGRGFGWSIFRGILGELARQAQQEEREIRRQERQQEREQAFRNTLQAAYEEGKRKEAERQQKNKQNELKLTASKVCGHIINLANKHNLPVYGACKETNQLRTCVRINDITGDTIRFGWCISEYMIHVSTWYYPQYKEFQVELASILTSIMNCEYDMSKGIILLK